MSLFRRRSSKKSPETTNRTKLESRLYVAQHGPDEIVDLSECGLSHIPSGTFTLCRVLRKEVLILHSNRLVDLVEYEHSPATSFKNLGMIETLRVLDLHDNNLHEVPNEIASLSLLQVLNLEKNKLRHLPENMGSLTHLQTLNVKDNRLKDLPVSVGHCTSLRHLDIRNNRVKELPNQLALCRSLESLALDAEQMEHPPFEVCFLGVDDIKRYLCAAMGIEFVAASKTIINLLPSAAASATNGLKSPFGLEDHKFDEAIYKLERDKQLRKKSQLEAERQLVESLESQAKMIADAQSNRSELIQKLASQEGQLNKAIKDSQMEKAKEHKRFVEKLEAFEQHSSKMLKELLAYHENAHRMEKFLESEEQKKAEEEHFLEVRREEYNALKRKEMSEAIHDTLCQHYSIEELRQLHDSRQRDLNEKLHVMDQNESNAVAKSLAARDAEMRNMLLHLCENEKAQKLALEHIMIQQDNRTARLNWQIALLQQELGQLSNLELQKRNERDHEHVKMCEKQRMELSFALAQFVDEREKRANHIRRRLLEMEALRESEHVDFWLVQMQRLLANKPLALQQAESQMDTDLVKLLNRVGASAFIPAFARNRVLTMKLLRCCSEEDLQKMGIYQVGLRKEILNAVAEFETKTVSPGGSPPPSAPPAVEKAVITAHFEMECVICMDSKCEIVLLPCGHVCVCERCSTPLDACPMCRGEIVQKVDLIAAAPSAPPID